MRLTRFIYYSKAVAPMNFQEVTALASAAARKNKELAVTGLLTCSSTYFLQVLEGERGVVSQLFEVISRDRRHKDVTIMSFAEISERRFAMWNMGLAGLSRTGLPLLLRYSAQAQLNPEAMGADSALALLQALGNSLESHVVAS